jgi:hypothetical protein
MKNFVKTVYLVCSIFFLIYLFLPNPSFPEPTSESLQSNEPADVETNLRRGFYTDLSRSQVLGHYQHEFSRSTFLDIPLPTYRLNYPPEEAQTLIRDQARSTFLEEIVHPFRESLFVNGFKPKEAKDVIVVDGKKWDEKIIIRFVPSNRIVRLLIGGFSLILFYVLILQWNSAVANLIKTAKEKTFHE